jgi:hypothetical protein
MKTYKKKIKNFKFKNNKILEICKIKKSKHLFCKKEYQKFKNSFKNFRLWQMNFIQNINSY